MCGDKAAVFATGFSNGGMMSNRLGCDAPDVFAMVAPVAGNVRIGGDLEACNPDRHVGWVSLCGTSDSACNRDFEETAKAWSVRNECADVDPVPTYNTATTECYRYVGCAPVWCSVVASTTPFFFLYLGSSFRLTHRTVATR